MSRNPRFGNPQNGSDLFPMLGVEKIVTAEKISRVGEQARAHRVALAGDGIRAGAGPADVAGHQREIDDCLGGAGGFMALVYAHRPPERDAFAAMNCFARISAIVNSTQTRGGRNSVQRELLYELGKGREVICPGRHEVLGNPPF